MSKNCSINHGYTAYGTTYIFREFRVVYKMIFRHHVRVFNLP